MNTPKLLIVALAALVAGIPDTAQSAVFINEFHYDDNGSTDSGESVEVVATAGEDLSGYRVVLYNGSNGSSYDDDVLSAGTTVSCGASVQIASISYPANGLQNGAPDGIALVGPADAVVQFLSYEGSFTATNGPANGLTSEDIGVAESAAPVGTSLQLIGNGSVYADFTWQTGQSASLGQCNAGQTFSSGGDDPPLVTSTAPNNNATNVAIDAEITLNFSEEVTASTASFTLECGSGALPFALSASPADSFTLNPDADLPNSAVCTVNALAAQIADTDGTADNPAADFSFSFTTIAPPPAITLISAVQGSAATSPLVGQTVRVRGIVIGDYQNASFPGFGQFFVQEEDSDADSDAATSEGIAVNCSACTAVDEGDLVEVTGTVAELFGTTAISPVDSVVVVSSANPLPSAASIDLPVPAPQAINDYFEPFEAMRVRFVDALVIGGFNDLFGFGEIDLFEGSRPRQFTEDNLPDAAGYVAHLESLARRAIILDDVSDGNRTVLGLPDGQEAIFHPQPNGFSEGVQGLDFFRGGDIVNGLTGVLQFSFSNWRIRPTGADPVSFSVANNRDNHATPPNVGGLIRVASTNLLNYFATLDTGASVCGPSANQGCRGANTSLELDRQRERTSRMICGLGADVVGLVEIENSATDAAIDDLLPAINARCGAANPYSSVSTLGAINEGDGVLATESLGTDAIRVGLLYRSGTITPAGAPRVFVNSTPFDRPPLAQTFEVNDPGSDADGERFTVVVNHFKSKGCGGASGADADQGDGQSCFAARRTAQATALASWINETVTPAANDPDVLIVGDLNSYARETPITALEAAGFFDLETLSQTNDYSYVFDSQIGRLDYALGNLGMASKVTGAAAWHINADESPLFDYNDSLVTAGEGSSEGKPDGTLRTPPRTLFDSASVFRTADHDPVLVGLFSPVNDAPSATILGDLTHPGGTTGLQTVTGFASAISPGPMDEAGQTVTLLVDKASDTNDVLSSIAITQGGELSYTLTGASGSAIVRLTVTDDGGTANGGQDRSLQEFRIVVGDSYDLSLRMTVGGDFKQGAQPDKGSLRTYIVSVTNHGPGNATGIQLSVPVPAGFVGMMWNCTTPAGVCEPNMGIEAVSTQLDLNSAQTASITISGNADNSREFLEFIPVVQVPGVAVINPADDRVVFITPVSSDAIFRNGLE